MSDYIQQYVEEPLDDSLNFTEFDKLVEMVTKAGWNYRVNRLHGGKQIVLYNKSNTEMLDDAVIHGFSNGRRAGLLETYILGDCRGWEHAEDIFNGWKEAWSL